jgi:hypothetical protein
MSEPEAEARTRQLRQKLAELETRFRIEARKRGFDPNQVENMALPAALAGLFTDCAAIRMELAELEDPGGEP